MGELIQGPWPEPPHRNLSMWQITEQFGVNKRTVQRWMKDGLPFDRDTDGHARFKKREVEEWLAARREESLDGAA